MGDPSSASGQGRRRDLTSRPFSPNHRAADDHLSGHIVSAVEAGVPVLIEAREIIVAFHLMIRRKTEADLSPWIERGRASLVASFANGVERDIAAVRAAIVSNWSKGQTEGQITKLKLVKRQMYGRGKLDLLQARLIGAT